MAMVAGHTGHQDVEKQDYIAQEIEVITSAGEAETVLVDGIKGISILNGIVRLNFIETYADTLLGGRLRGRHVITVAMAQQNLVPIMELLNKVVGELAAPKLPVSDPAPNA